MIGPVIKVNYDSSLVIAIDSVLGANLYFQDKSALRENLKWKCKKVALIYQDGINVRKRL